MSARVAAGLLASLTLLSPVAAAAQEHGEHHGSPMGVECRTGEECASGSCLEVDGDRMCTAECTADNQCDWALLCGDAGVCQPASLGQRMLKVMQSTEFIGALFNFVCLLALIYFGARKPLAQYLKKRRQGIEEGLSEAKRLKETAEKLLEQYSTRLENLDVEMDRLRAEMSKAGEVERDHLVHEAEVKAARMRREVEFLITQQTKQLRDDLKREAVEAAVAAAEQVLRDKTGAADQERLAQSYLKAIADAGREDRA